MILPHNLLHRFSPEVVRHVREGLQALVETPSQLGPDLRRGLLARVAAQHGSRLLAEIFADDLDGGASVAVREYLDTVSQRPAATQERHIIALQEEGLSTTDIIIVNQIAAVAAVAARLVEGQRALSGEGVLPSVTAASPAPSRPPIGTWRPWLPPVSAEDLSPELVATYGKRLDLPFLRVLAPVPDLLHARVGMDQAALLDRDGLDRGEREIAATVKSRMTGCSTCAQVHAGKAEHLLREPGLAPALLTARDYGAVTLRRQALVHFAHAFAEVPVRPVAADDLRAVGLSEADLDDLLAAVAYMAWPNRVTLGLGAVSADAP